MDRLASIRAFVAIAKRGSFSAAADSLWMSKAMTSKHVRSLEDPLGARPFHRNTRRCRLTDAGQVYRDRWNLTDHEEAERSLTQRGAEPRGTPGSPPLPPSAPVISPRRSEAYRGLYPAVHAYLAFGDRLVDVVGEGFDVAVRVGSLPGSSLIGRKVACTGTVVCGAPAYLERHGVPRVPADLDHHHCVCYTQGRSGDGWPFKGSEGGCVRAAITRPK